MKRFVIPILMMIIFSFTQMRGFAQEIPVKQDSLDLKTGIGGEILPGQSDSIKAGELPLRLPRLNPAENFIPQFTPYQRFNLPTPPKDNINLPPIQWHGVASDFINVKSRTAIAATMPSPRLLLHSSATLGLVETPFFGKGNYYILDAGASYSVNSRLVLGVSGGYNSNFETMPFWNTGINAAYQVSPNLMIDGGVTYVSTANNLHGLNQWSVNLDLHGRYRITNDIYFNAYGGMPVSQSNNRQNMPMMPMMNSPYYGGSFEYWFKPAVGVEGGVIMIRDMFSGRMRPQPKLELLFRPGR